MLIGHLKSGRLSTSAQNPLHRSSVELLWIGLGFVIAIASGCDSCKFIVGQFFRAYPCMIHLRVGLRLPPRHSAAHAGNSCAEILPQISTTRQREPSKAVTTFSSLRSRAAERSPRTVDRSGVTTLPSTRACALTRRLSDRRAPRHRQPRVLARFRPAHVESSCTRVPRWKDLRCGLRLGHP